MKPMQPELFPLTEYLNPAYGMTARSTRSKDPNRKAAITIVRCMSEALVNADG